MCGVTHHLLSVLEPHKKANVRIFREMATKTIEDLWSRSTLPVIVGGTHYYVEALLFQRLCDENGSAPRIPLMKAGKSVELDPYLQLQQMNPLLASTIHPNDSRRIHNALATEVLPTFYCYFHLFLSHFQRILDCPLYLL